MAKGGGGMFEIIMLVVVLGGAWLLWPQISGMLEGVSAGAVDTDTSGGGKADASDKGGTVTAGNGGGGQYGFPDAEEMIRQITAQAKRGGKGQNIRQRNSGKGGTNISVQGKGATACANGKCVSGYGEMMMDFSNVI